MTSGKRADWWWPGVNIVGSVGGVAGSVLSIVQGNWMALGTTLLVVAVLLGGSWVIRRRGRQPVHLFLSMQMSDLTNEEYVKVRQEIMDVVFDLRRFHKVYFYNEFVQRQETFDELRFDVRDYLAEIDAADVFVAVVTEKVVSSIYFEAGYALAKGKRCLYFIANDRLVPVLMRRVGLLHDNVRVYWTTDLRDVNAILRDVGWNDGNA